jgi:hypothetical protein
MLSRMRSTGFAGTNAARSIDPPRQTRCHEMNGQLRFSATVTEILNPNFYNILPPRSTSPD